MRESAGMTELRKIKEELSLEYASMTLEEMKARFNEVEEQVYKEFGIKFPSAEPPKEASREPFDYNRLRENYFENMTVEQVCEAVTEYKVKRQKVKV